MLVGLPLLFRVGTDEFPDRAKSEHPETASSSLSVQIHHELLRLGLKIKGCTKLRRPMIGGRV
jgi:hypothetical protein